MATRKSINTAKELVKKYRSITFEELKSIEGSSSIDEYGRAKARQLTGFSSPNCPLCTAVGNYCGKCIYGGYYLCFENKNKETYFAIVNARNDEELLVALRNRADHIESIINKLEQGV